MRWIKSRVSKKLETDEQRELIAMAYQQKDGQGSIFKNDNKESEKHPDYSGTCLLGGQEFWINGWIKKPEGKKPYMSLSIKLKEPRGQGGGGQGGGGRQQQAPQNNYSQQRSGGNAPRGGGSGPNWEKDLDDQVPFLPSR